MEENTFVPPEPSCTFCNKTVGLADNFCTYCAYPLAGTAEQQNDFLATMEVQKTDREKAGKNLKNATKTLYVLAGLSCFFGFVIYSINSDPEYLVIAVMLPILYGGLGIWSKTKPLAAIISAVVLYVTLQLLAVFEDPATLFQGIIIKIIVLVYLIKGLKAALKAEQINKLHPVLQS